MPAGRPSIFEVAAAISFPHAGASCAARAGAARPRQASATSAVLNGRQYLSDESKLAIMMNVYCTPNVPPPAIVDPIAIETAYVPGPGDAVPRLYMY